jgi:hypothetical protein
VGGGALLGDARPLELDTRGGVGYMGACIIGFYIGCMAFTRPCLPYAGIAMSVFLVMLPSQTVMGQVPALEYMLSCAHGLL